MLALAILAATHPYQLDFGAPGRHTAPLGWSSTSTGRATSLAEVVKAAEGHRFVLVGESHDNADHHRMQADVIEALVKSGRRVAVGLEMFTRDNQASLNPWTLGWWSEAEFIEQAKWKTQWGFDYSLYRPIFEAVRTHRLPMAALNLPRDWVRQVGRQGPSVLTEVQRRWAPNIDISNKEHRALFTAMIGGHPLEGQRGDNMYAAQVSWDEAMAQSAVDFMTSRKGEKWVMVIIAGSGHTLYGLGINLRLKMKGHSSLNLVGLEEPLPEGGISRGVADFVFVSPKVERPKG
jgi:uncharacterized iron-regulated protein